MATLVFVRINERADTCANRGTALVDASPVPDDLQQPRAPAGGEVPQRPHPPDPPDLLEDDPMLGRR